MAGRTLRTACAAILADPDGGAAAVAALETSSGTAGLYNKASSEPSPDTRPTIFLQERAVFLAGRLAKLEAAKARAGKIESKIGISHSLEYGAQKSGAGVEALSYEGCDSRSFAAALAVEQLESYRKSMEDAGCASWSGLAAMNAEEVGSLGSILGLKKLELRRLERLHAAARATAAQEDAMASHPEHVETGSI
eukprot:SAG31_NODE_2179_length_6249_cov_15.633984_2_plen_194_part_00